jgi:hypothetical protein
VVSIPWDRSTQKNAVLILQLMLKQSGGLLKNYASGVNSVQEGLLGESCIRVIDLVRDGKGGKEIELQLFKKGQLCGESTVVITASGRSLSPVFKHNVTNSAAKVIRLQVHSANHLHDCGVSGNIEKTVFVQAYLHDDVDGMLVSAQGCSLPSPIISNLPAGKLSVPFTFRLPQGLPASFEATGYFNSANTKAKEEKKESNIGQVQYCLQSAIVRTVNQADAEEDDANFTIVTPITGVNFPALCDECA